MKAHSCCWPWATGAHRWHHAGPQESCVLNEPQCRGTVLPGAHPVSPLGSSELPRRGAATGANCTQVVVIISSFHHNSELLPLAKCFLQQPVINSTLKCSPALLFLSDKYFCCQLLLQPDTTSGISWGWLALGVPEPLLWICYVLVVISWWSYPGAHVLLPLSWCPYPGGHILVAISLCPCPGAHNLVVISLWPYPCTHVLVAIHWSRYHQGSISVHSWLLFHRAQGEDFHSPLPPASMKLQFSHRKKKT